MNNLLSRSSPTAQPRGEDKDEKEDTQLTASTYILTIEAAPFPKPLRSFWQSPAS